MQPIDALPAWACRAAHAGWLEEVGVRTRLLLLLVGILVPLLTSCGPGGGDRAEDEPCPTVTGGSTPTSTTTPCVVGATEDGGTTGGGGYDFTLTQPIPEAGGTQIQTANLDIRLMVDGDRVSGTIEGPTRQELTQPACPSGTVTDGRTMAEVEGTLTGELLELRVVSVTWKRPEVEPCPGGGPAELIGLLGEGTASGIIGFDESLSRLERADDGAYRYDHTETVDGYGYPYTLEYHVVVRFKE